MAPTSRHNCSSGLQVWGSYGGALLIQSNYVPRYYAAVVATGGQSRRQPGRLPRTRQLGLLRLAAYSRSRSLPAAGQFYVRGFGVGTRHRGVAAVAQITENLTYTPPTTIET
jgi:hypothetical protein